jgi:predicted AlkP superfamily pyrophosphatase or phosphodiesterase
MQTLSPAGLATITTGVNPSLHGVVAEKWINHVTGSHVSLIDDATAQGIGCEPKTECYSNVNLVMPTIGDELLLENHESKVISVASDATSAIIMGGQRGVAYWMDHTRASWVSSSKYMAQLPSWLVSYNETRAANFHIPLGWSPGRPLKQYLNTSSTIFPGGTGSRVTTFSNKEGIDYAGLLHSPACNSLVAEFAARVVEGEAMGKDNHPDILNVCFDASRVIGQRFGSRAMELEDMIYKLDFDLASMVKAINDSAGGEEKVLWVLTSDCGASDAWAAGHTPHDRFVANQFETLLNSFLVGQYGPGNWVVDYIDRQLYLNHTLIYQKNLNLTDVQNRAAVFALQFRGVSHVLTSTTLSGGYFGESYGQKMQNSFYPKRAGDLMLNLMPSWIEERGDTRSLPGSMYDYDTHVPLLFWGWNIPAQVVSEQVDMTAIAPTIARIIGFDRPIASDGRTLPGI